MSGVVDLTIEDEEADVGAAASPHVSSISEDDDVVEVVDARTTQSTAGESHTTGSATDHQASKPRGVHDGLEEEDLLEFDIQKVAANCAAQRSLSSTTRRGAPASIGGLSVTCYEDEGDSLSDVLDEGAIEDDSSADEQRPTSSVTKKGHQGRPKRSKEEREAEAAAKKADKQREKESKAEAKKQKKARQDKEKEEAQSERREQALKQKQVRGTFKEEEIMLVMEMALSHTETGIRVLEVVREKYNAMALEGMGAQGIIRWTHRPKGLGGAGAPGEVNVEDLRFALVLWRASHFLDLLTRGLGRSGDEACAFLQQELAKIRGHHPCVRDGRLVLVLQGVQEEVLRRQQLDFRQGQQKGRGDGGHGVVSSETLEDVIMWLLLEQDVDVKMTKDDAESGQYVLDVTRSLAEMPYRDKATDLQSVVKAKLRMGEQDNGSGEKSLPKELSETWCRQLVQIPGLSEGKARSLMEHYPTLKALLDEYNRLDLSEGDKQSLLQHKLTDKGPAKTEKVLSKRIYTFYMSSNSEDPCG